MNFLLYAVRLPLRSELDELMNNMHNNDIVLFIEVK
jgi:hypothetical protein